MRRDLSRACSVCRLRFSAALLGCPACGRKALGVAEAMARVEAPARAAWLAKWAIVIVMAPAFALSAWTGLHILRESFPPENAVDVPLLFLGAMATYMGATITLAAPVWLWVKLVALLRWIFGRFVDRRANPLRVTLDRGARREERASPARGWLGKLQGLRARLLPADRPLRIWVIGGAVVLGAEVLAEIFGRKRTLDFSSLEAFGSSLVIVLVVNGVCLVIGGFVFSILRHILAWSFGHLAGPPALLAFERQPPALDDALVARWRAGRAEVTGRAEPLTEEERAALARHCRNAASPNRAAAERVELAAPFSRKPCLAFRVAGEREGQPLDDADVISFAVVTLEGRRVMVDAADVVVLLPPRGPLYKEGADDFLRARDLSGGEVAARETRLAEGERVSVLGRLERLEVAGGGYREQRRLELLDAGDGQPVLIDAPTIG